MSQQYAHQNVGDGNKKHLERKLVFERIVEQLIEHKSRPAPYLTNPVYSFFRHSSNLANFAFVFNLLTPMQVIKKSIEGLIEIIPAVYKDERGSFFETFNKETFEAKGIPTHFVQDNQSFSKKGVVRGLHFQRAPFAQGKLVRVVSGRVLDVAVDIRPDSPTFGKYETVELSAELNNLFYVPEGFAHGFVALEDSIFIYKCTNVYNKASEGGIIWNDPDLNIDWQITNPIVSEKDLQLPTFKGYFDQIPS